MWGDGAIPRWFEDWLNAEREATTLRIWQSLLVPGKVEMADYARALFLGGLLNPSEDAIGQLVAARLARQSIFDRPDPPNLCPWPYSRIETACPVIAIESDIVFDYGSVRSPGNDSIAAYVIQVVIANHHMQAWEPVRPHRMVTLGCNSRAIHSPHDVAFDSQIVKAAGSEVSNRPEYDSPVVFACVRAVDIVDVKSGKYDVPGCTEIVEHDVNAATRYLRVAMIDDLQIMNFDSLDILQQYNVVHSALAIESRQCPQSVPPD